MKLGKYQHYKGNCYEVLGIAKHSETTEEFIVYKALYGEEELWIRPTKMFLEDVEISQEDISQKIKELEQD